MPVTHVHNMSVARIAWTTDWRLRWSVDHSLAHVHSAESARSVLSMGFLGCFFSKENVLAHVCVCLWISTLAVFKTINSIIHMIALLMWTFPCLLLPAIMDIYSNFKFNADGGGWRQVGMKLFITIGQPTTLFVHYAINPSGSPLPILYPCKFLFFQFTDGFSFFRDGVECHHLLFALWGGHRSWFYLAVLYFFTQTLHLSSQITRVLCFCGVFVCKVSQSYLFVYAGFVYLVSLVLFIACV